MKVIQFVKGNTLSDLNTQSKIPAQNVSCQMHAIAMCKIPTKNRIPTAI